MITTLVIVLYLLLMGVAKEVGTRCGELDFKQFDASCSVLAVVFWPILAMYGFVMLSQFMTKKALELIKNTKITK